jgi:hypothetical protein
MKALKYKHSGLAFSYLTVGLAELAESRPARSAARLVRTAESVARGRPRYEAHLPVDSVGPVRRGQGRALIAARLVGTVQSGTVRVQSRECGRPGPSRLTYQWARPGRSSRDWHRGLHAREDMQGGESPGGAAAAAVAATAPDTPRKRRLHGRVEIA